VQRADRAWRAQRGQLTKGAAMHLTERCTAAPARRAGQPRRGRGRDSTRAKPGTISLRSSSSPLRIVEEVAALSNVVKTHSHLPHVTLNSDGRPHPLENTLAIVTLVTGVAAFALGFVVAQHLSAVILGLVALATGMYVQMISATREERIIIVTGLVAAFVGAGLGFAHGGFSV
jgi:hypothetical protein